MEKNISSKSGKEFKQFGLTSSTSSFGELKSVVQSKLVQNRLMNHSDTKKDSMKMQSTMVNTVLKN